MTRRQLRNADADSYVMRPRPPRGARPRPGEAPRSYAVKRGSFPVLDCTRCGVKVETIDIGVSAAPDLVADTFVCCLCLSDGIWDAVGAEGPAVTRDARPPSAPEAPLVVLRTLVERREQAAPPDILALLGGPEGRPEAPPLSLVPPVARPPFPVDAQDDDGDADGGLHHWSNVSLW